jgi:transposase, IS5 family
MMTQSTLSVGGFDTHSKVTRMDKLVPWSAFEELIEPQYPKAGNGRPPRDLSTMLRMYCVANWFNLADEACEDAMYDIVAFREFCRIDLGRQGVPDATTLLNFRHLLERHELGAAIFARVGELLVANGLKLSGGTIVDATIIAAPSSTKNEDKARDPQTHSTSKGGHWHFGMKAHIGADNATGIVHSASVTAANVHDNQQLDKLLHGQESRLYGDSAYANQRAALKAKAPKAKDFTNKRAYRNKPLTERDKQVNRTKSQTRAKVEHPFLTLKRIWGFAKVRYRGLTKNANRIFAMLALINIDKWNKPLLA